MVMEYQMKNTIRVLACHSNKATLSHLTSLLNPAGIRTDCADDIGLAESLLIDNNYDAVLLDLFLADLDGISFADTLNEAFPDLPVLIFSSWPDPARPEMTAAWPIWNDSYTRHVRLIFALKVIASNVWNHRPCFLCIGSEDDCPEKISTSLARHASLVRARTPFELEEAISSNDFDLVIYSPDPDAVTAHDNYRILLDSVMPLQLVIHSRPGAGNIVDLVRQTVKMEIPLPGHKPGKASRRPVHPALDDLTDFKTSKGID